MFEPLTQFDPILGKELAQLMFALEVTFTINVLLKMLANKKTNLFGAVFTLVLASAVNWYLIRFGWYYIAMCLGGFIASFVLKGRFEVYEQDSEDA